MGKGHRHLKNLKSEKAKVKLRTKKPKLLPKGLNVTNTSFKVKKIVIREQLKQHDETEILSKRKLNVKELLIRLQHHNLTIRQQAVNELKEILLKNPQQILNLELNSLLQGISALSLDKEKSIRRDSLKVLNLILKPISNDQLIPFYDALISHLRCAMTHIDPNIKEDSLQFLDVLIQNCGNLLAKNSHKLLPNFLDLISKLHNENKPGRQLTITLNAKTTTTKWRINVLERLSSMLLSIINYKKDQKIQRFNADSKIINVTKETKYIPLYKDNESQMHDIDFQESFNLINNDIKNSDVETLIKYMNILMPLMFESWIELCPENKNTSVTECIISTEASALLKYIIEIIQLLCEYIDMLDYEDYLRVKLRFKTLFQNAYIKKIFLKFPYSKATIFERTKKRQEDFCHIDTTEKCLEQNLGICQVYIWLSFIDTNNQIIDKSNKNYCNYIINYLNERITNWTNNDNSELQLLIKVLKTLFLKASKVWYANHVSLKSVLQTIIQVCSNQPRKELQLQLFIIIGEIMLNHTLNELHGEVVFKDFVATLPNLLLESTIHDHTIHMINRVVLRYREWIQDILIKKHKDILDNAKRIEIIGSEDQKRSRLTICNLFYFLDKEIYF